MCLYCQIGQKHPPCFQGALQCWLFLSWFVCPSGTSLSHWPLLTIGNLWLSEIYTLWYCYSLVAQGTVDRRCLIPLLRGPGSLSFAQPHNGAAYWICHAHLFLQNCIACGKRNSILWRTTESKCPAVNPQKPKQWLSITCLQQVLYGLYHGLSCWLWSFIV